MFRYKIDVMAALSDAGYSMYRIKKEKIIGGKSVDDIRAGVVVGIKTLETLCRLLHCQPGDLIEYVEE